ncbi:MAG: 2-succinyl-5-enolpyruvyl-6-hydroxy-3-cyclohexene-1-carboxylic-acid synthase [Acidobacteriota bacterium]
MKIENIPNINYLWAELIIEELLRNGVSEFCIAPGSRSTPLTLAAAGSNKAKKTIHYDERGLAFYALGMASAGAGPVAVISTSGTAAANFFPALIEASKKKLPIIFLTADRPPELRQTGALQTIDQPGLYGKYVRWDFDLPVPDPDIEPEVVLTTIDQAVFRSKYPMAGPVHINCMFREPLAPGPGKNTNFSNYKIRNNWEKSQKPYTEYFSDSETEGVNNREEIIKVIEGIKKGIIITGKLKGPGEKDKAVELSKKLNWPLFPDIVSGLRNRDESGNIIHYYDLLLLSGKELNEQIDGIIHLGGRITSKRWYNFIKGLSPDKYITVLDHPLRNDPLHIVSHRIKSSVSGFLNTILPSLRQRGTNPLTEKLKKISSGTGEIIDKFLENKEINEIFIARKVSNLIPDDSGLFLSNSMPVRDMDMYSSINNRDVKIGGNRGASGIDGIIASASGFTESLGKPVTLIIGDIAFLHDLNSLDFVKKGGNKLIIIVINNNGGNIFSFLPVAEHKTHFEKYFITPHGMKFDKAASMFGIEHKKVSNKNDFSVQYKSALAGKKSKIIEVEVEREQNVAAHRELEEKIREYLGKN